ncbi:hypothetical protein QL285_020986 [Trifolium repens]|nr:hypothetical protein QL285_020986 [Trifolium repens]
MVVRSLDLEKDPFKPKEKDEELLSPEVSYLSVIEALMYLANYTHPDIAFSVNLLSSSGSPDGYKPQLLAQQLLPIVVAPLIATVASPNRRSGEDIMETDLLSHR